VCVCVCVWQESVFENWNLIFRVTARSFFLDHLLWSRLINRFWFSSLFLMALKPLNYCFSTIIITQQFWPHTNHNLIRFLAAIVRACVRIFKIVGSHGCAAKDERALAERSRNWWKIIQQVVEIEKWRNQTDIEQFCCCCCCFHLKELIDFQATNQHKKQFVIDIHLKKSIYANVRSQKQHVQHGAAAALNTR